MPRINLKQGCRSLRSAISNVLRFFGFGEMPIPKSPLLRSEHEELGKTRTIKEGKRADLYEMVKNESEFSLERILASPEEIQRRLSGLRPEEAVQGMNEHLVYLREVKEKRQLEETRVFRRRLLLRRIIRTIQTEEMTDYITRTKSTMDEVDALFLD